MKLQRKKLVGLFALLPLWAKAMVITFIIGCTVLIVGGIVIYELYQMTKVLYQPPTQQTNSVVDWASSWSTGFKDTNGVLYANMNGGYNPYWARINYTNPGYAPAFTFHNNGFTLQYGLDATNAPWLVPGSGLATNQIVTLQTLASTDSNYVVAVTMYGITTVYSATANDAGGQHMSLDATTGGTVTNAAGDKLYSITNSPKLVVIERTTNYFRTWTPIFTNSVRAGTVQNFTDTSSPPMIQPNLVPPGATVSTNAGPFNSTGVFYRLVIP